MPSSGAATAAAAAVVATAGSMKKAVKPPPSVLNPNWASLQEKIAKGGGARTLTTTSAVLGKRKDRPTSDTSPEPEPEPTAASVLLPTSDDFSLTDELAMDCEMVGVSSQGNKNALARVALINTWGNVVYDEYVRPLERVVDFRTNISGIHPRDMRRAKQFMTVQKQVAELIKGKILVGHALHNDLKVLLLSHPKKDTRDTSSYLPFLSKEGRKRALKDLAAQVLGVKIQQKEHCPIEDARAAMLVYKKYKKEWEKSIKAHERFKNKVKNKHRKKSLAKDAAVDD